MSNIREESIAHLMTGVGSASANDKTASLESHADISQSRRLTNLEGMWCFLHNGATVSSACRPEVPLPR